MSTIPWLQGLEPGPQALLSGRGRLGGLQLFPPRLEARFVRAMQEVSAASEEASSRGEWVDDGTLVLAMSVGLTWDVSLDTDGRLVLPETPRKLGIVPGAGQIVAIFIFGEVVQLWRPEALTDLLDRRSAQIADLLDSLGE